MIPPTFGVVVDTEHGFHVVVVAHRVNVLPVWIQDETIVAIVVDDRLSLLCSEFVVLCTLVKRVTSHRHINSSQCRLCSLLGSPNINSEQAARLLLVLGRKLVDSCLQV